MATENRPNEKERKKQKQKKIGARQGDRAHGAALNFRAIAAAAVMKSNDLSLDWRLRIAAENETKKNNSKTDADRWLVERERRDWWRVLPESSPRRASPPSRRWTRRPPPDRENQQETVEKSLHSDLLKQKPIEKKKKNGKPALHDPNLSAFSSPRCAKENPVKPGKTR